MARSSRLLYFQLPTRCNNATRRSNTAPRHPNTRHRDTPTDTPRVLLRDGRQYAKPARGGNYQHHMGSRNRTTVQACNDVQTDRCHRRRGFQFPVPYQDPSTQQPLNHSATTQQPLNHSATTQQPLSNHSATTQQPLSNHSTTNHSTTQICLPLTNE